jgi:tripartite-type tricarboxylate transporter receptor subunit TctC
LRLLASIPNLLVSGASFPPNNMKELIAYAKARPGQLNYSNPVGAYSHLDMLEFMSKAGIQMVECAVERSRLVVRAGDRW